MQARTGSLCGRCGAVLPELDAPVGVQAHGACPECGLGSTGVTTRATAAAPAAPDAAAAALTERQLAAMRAETRAIVGSCPFPLLGLDGRWGGSRWVGGHATSSGAVRSIELAHGDPFDEGAALVRVATHDGAGAHRALERAEAAHGLAEAVWRAGGDHALVTATYRSVEPTASWGELVLAVDGEPTPFRTLAAGTTWVALGDLAGTFVAVEARHVDPAGVGLVQVADTSPYLSGTPG